MIQGIRHLIVSLRDRQQQALRAQSGQSLVVLAMAFLGLIAMLGLALDLGLVYIERVRIKRAVDAATLAGVVELPFEEDAFSRAIEYLNLNGYNIDRVDGDANVYVVGCIWDFDDWDEDGSTDDFVDHTTPYTYIQVANPHTEFILAAMPAPGPGNERTAEDCQNVSDPKGFGNGNRLVITGTVDVNMNFMQFFGYRVIPVQDWAIAQNVTDLDVVVVFDVSGSMEFTTICYDCWVRTDSTNPDYPNNGYFNPIPAATLNSDLCSLDSPPLQVPYEAEGYKYLVAEAELAASNPPLWGTRYRQMGQGYWAIQRGSRSDDQNNRAGDPSRQSSNVCLVPGIDCTAEGDPSDDVCNDDPGDDVVVDCSAYISHHPFVTYGQNTLPTEQVGMFYYLADVIDNDPSPPKLEYDFRPDWSGPTYIWIRAQGGGSRAYEPIYGAFLQNKGTIHWDVLSTTDPFDPQTNTDALGVDRWRDTRADPSMWRWIQLGTTTATFGESLTLRLWAGSPGYDIDKIIVTNDPRYGDFIDDGRVNGDYEPIDVLEIDDPAPDIGPPATDGSATRAACDPCNPIYGLQVAPEECTGYASVTTATNNLADPLFGDVEPLRTSQEAVKRFIQRQGGDGQRLQRLEPEFDQVGFVPFTYYIYRDGQSQLECLKRDGQACFDPDVQDPPISYTHVLEKVENNYALHATDIAWGMLEGLKELGVNVANEPLCGAGENPFDDDCFDNRCTSDNRTGCGRGGAATRVMVVLTDGSPNENPQDEKGVSCANDPTYNFPYEDDDDYDCVIYYAGKAAESNVTVYTIGLGEGARAELLGLAAETGRGQYFYAPSPQDLDAIFSDILSNIYVRLIR